jgi:ribonuclease D
MSERSPAQPELIYTPKSYVQMLQTLGRRKLYHTKVCLIQLTVSAAGEEQVTEDAPEQVLDFLVDPLRLTDLTDLAAVLAADGVEVVMHAADNDMLLLQRLLGFRFHQIFDTQLAGRILGWRQIGLAAILEENYGFVSDKRMQRTNWGKRPLTAEQIAYAHMDTHYLLALRSRQIQLLRTKGRWEEAQDAFQQLIRTSSAPRPVEARSFWSLKQVRDVPLDKLNVLEALWQWREEQAEALDRPPFKVIGDQHLIELANAQPTDFDGLLAHTTIADGLLHRYGRTLLEVVAAGQSRPAPRLPQRNDTYIDRAVLDRFDQLRRWRSTAAESRGVAPDIVFNNSTLQLIAQRMPTTVDELAAMADVGKWKAETYGAQLLAVLHHR